MRAGAARRQTPRGCAARGKHPRPKQAAAAGGGAACTRHRATPGVQRARVQRAARAPGPRLDSWNPQRVPLASYVSVAADVAWLFAQLVLVERGLELGLHILPILRPRLPVGPLPHRHAHGAALAGHPTRGTRARRRSCLLCTHAVTLHRPETRDQRRYWPLASTATEGPAGREVHWRRARSRPGADVRRLRVAD